MRKRIIRRTSASYRQNQAGAEKIPAPGPRAVSLSGIITENFLAAKRSKIAQKRNDFCDLFRPFAAKQTKPALAARQPANCSVASATM
jgi:hypothetical protein